MRSGSFSQLPADCDTIVALFFLCPSWHGDTSRIEGDLFSGFVLHAPCSQDQKWLWAVLSLLEGTNVKCFNSPTKRKRKTNNYLT
jgi:hypothetical protein